ncbi:MAG TPA: PAS domain S-box protein, partial [Pirellulales bacterium]|nr:PAS domain S-box protein [Pirellulales bacterium]
MSTAPEATSARYPFSILFLGGNDRYRSVAALLERSTRIKLEIRRAADRAAALDAARMQRCDVLLLDALDNRQEALELLHESAALGSPAARILLVAEPTDPSAPADAIVCTQELSTEALERGIATALTESRKRLAEREQSSASATIAAPGTIASAPQPIIDAMVRDLSEAKESERQSRQSQRFLQGTLDALSARIAIVDDRGAILAVNEAWRRFAESQPALQRSATVGANYLEACALDLADCGREGPRVAHGIRQILLGHRHEFQLTYPLHEPGLTRWFVMRATRFPGQGPLCVVVAHEDVTELRQVEQSLEEMSRQNQLILNSVSEGIIGFDVSGRTIFINRAAAEMTGWSDSEFVRAGAHDFLHRGEGAAERTCDDCPVCATLADGKIRHHDDHLVRRHAGGTFPVEYNCAPIWEDGRLSGAVLTFRDITDRKRLQAQLLQAQKLESIGQLAAGI